MSDKNLSESLKNKIVHMKTRFNYYVFFFLILLIISCQKEIDRVTEPDSIVPTLTTTAVSAITDISAISGGTITSDGGENITARGVCWGTSPGPIVTGNNTSNGTGTGAFSSNLTGLSPSTLYYVRAYATNSVGTAYGNELSFTTLPTAPVLPTLTTAALTAITYSTSTSGGNVSADGGATVTARGVCWSTTPNPLATGNHTTDGTGTGTFISSVTGLTANTTYFIRAYATNSAGTAYGNELNFTTSTLPDIYIAGFENNSGFTPIPKIWKNGTATSLPYNTSGGADANSVYVSGTDVYVAGSDSSSQPVIWKNGVPTILSTPGLQGEAFSIYISGADVYVAGYEYDINNAIRTAKIWKNGIATSLTNGNTNAEAYSIFVSGTDVYVAGYEFNGLYNVAKTWKNGSFTPLSNGTSHARARSVFVSGIDVYAVGYEVNGSNNTALIWKNGSPTSLSSGTTVALSFSVFVSGTDVYAAGYEILGGKYVARLWKNGVASSLTNGINDAFAQSIFVSGADVYVVGREYNGTNYIAKMWKNGVATSLTNGNFEASGNAVFVK